MRPVNQRFFMASLMFLSFAAFNGCAGDNKSSSGGGGTAATGNGLHAEVLDKVYCNNPIPLTDSSLKSADSPSDVSGKWDLAELDIYSVDQSTNDSYAVQATAGNGFQPQVSCNGLSDLASANYQRSYTDSDGTQHDDSGTANRKISGDISTSEWLNPAELASSPMKRQISVHFENGKLVSADTSEIASDSTAAGGVGPIDHLSLGNDTYLSARRYLSPAGQMEIRFELDYPADDSGNRQIQYGRAVFSRGN
jgi:hypothetical protein